MGRDLCLAGGRSRAVSNEHLGSATHGRAGRRLGSCSNEAPKAGAAGRTKGVVRVHSVWRGRMGDPGRWLGDCTARQGYRKCSVASRTDGLGD